MILKLLAFALLSIPASHLLATPGSPPARQAPAAEADAMGFTWRTVHTQSLSDARVRPDEGQLPGMAGASAHAFRIDRGTRGMVVIDSSMRGTLSAFIGWGPPEAHHDAGKRDLRVVFIELNGTRHPQSMDAGGGHGLFFRSPADVPIENLHGLELQARTDAPWLL